MSFGDAVQVFNCGASSCGTYGMTAGLAAALERWGSLDVAALAAPAAAMAREGVALNAAQAYVFEILEPILVSTAESRAAFAPDGRSLREGDLFRSPELAETIERFGADGAAPFYTGDLAGAVVDWVERRRRPAHARRPRRLRARRARAGARDLPRAHGPDQPAAVGRRDAAGARHGPPGRALGGRAVRRVDIVAVMEEAQALRTPAFVEGLVEPGFADRLLASRLGSTTHISVLDGDGRACSVTCTNGEGSGLVVPGTGIHVNNVMGEQDLNPLGFFTYPPGRRMPSMMAPTVVLGTDGEVELVLGSAGSNRIRSAILQVIVGVVDHGQEARDAVLAPRAHFEDDVVYVEPGIDVDALRDAGREVLAFRDRNLFFGGVQAVERDRVTGALSGAGDPRRGGAAVAA